MEFLGGAISAKTVFSLFNFSITRAGDFAGGGAFSFPAVRFEDLLGRAGGCEELGRSYISGTSSSSS